MFCHDRVHAYDARAGDALSTRVAFGFLLFVGIVLGGSHVAAANDTNPPSDSTVTEVSNDSLGVPITAIDARGVAFDLRARRITAAGVVDTLWRPDSTQVRALAQPLGFQRVSDGDGGWFVAWIDERNGDPDIYLQRFVPGDTVAADWPKEGLLVGGGPGSQYHPTVAPDGMGGIYLAWEDYRGLTSGDIYAARITSAGSLANGWPEGGLAVCATPDAQVLPSIAASVDGAYVSWLDRRSGGQELWLQRLQGNGESSPPWPQGGIPVAPADSSVTAATIGQASSGKLIALWQCDGSAKGLYALPISGELPSQGTPVTTITEGAADLGDLAIAQAGGDKLLLCWSEWHGESGSLRLQSLDLASGTAEWGQGGLAIHQGVLGRGAPTILAGQSGGLVAWQDYQSRESDIRVLKFGPYGVRDQAWPEGGVQITRSGQNAYAATLHPDGSGGALIAWNFVVPDSVIEAELAESSHLSSIRPLLVSVNASADLVRITWQTRSGVTSPFDVYRRAAGETWTSLKYLVPNSKSLVVMDDRAVQEGDHLEYRIGFVDQGSRVFLAPVAVNIPIAPKVLTLDQVRVRGSEHALLVKFSLPRGPQPRLDLIDVTGRRAAKEQLAGLQPGVHEVRFNLPTRLAPGVYFLRLLQGSEERTAKTIYLR